MDLSYFNFLAKYILDDTSITEKYPWKIAIYRLYENSWYEGDKPVTNSKIMSLLHKAWGCKKDQKFQNIHITRLENLDAIIATIIPPRTRHTTIGDFSKRLAMSISNAEHKYYAMHDKLTRLYNRVGFEKEFQRKLAETNVLDSGNRNSTSSRKYIALLILDIDHFKQLNDSYDHSFGDAVLKAFAWRIKDFSAELETVENVGITLGRQGGEEFEILLTNLSGKAQTIKIAELFREKINSEVIPSKSQLPAIVKELQLEHIKIPPERERHIRASIGCAVLLVNSRMDSVADQTYAELKRKADAALSRAKADGRDRVCNYDHILQKHGRVIRSFPEVSLVAIDLGEDVGAMAGDVFEVTPVEFSGGYELTREDARSTRLLGIIPRIPTAKIVVVETQREVSFCRVIESTGNDPFPHNASLRKIPCGINTPILDVAVPELESALCSYSAFEKSLNQLSDFTGLVFISIEPICGGVNCTERSASEVQRKHLHAFVHGLRIILPPKTIFGYVDYKTIVLKFHQLDADEKITRKYINQLASISIENHRVIIGALLKDTLENIVREGLSYSPGAILYYVRLAHFVAKKGATQNVEIFDITETCKQAIYDLRLENRKSDMLLEYHRLSSYGFKNANLDNQIGIILLEMNDMTFLSVAEQAIESAIAIDDNEVAFKANLAIVKTKLAKYQDAYGLFVDARKFMDESGLYWLYSLAFAKAAMEQYKRDQTVIKPDDLTKAIRRALADSSPSSVQEIEWYSEIEMFSKAIQNRMT